jgi:hypothetical protein
MFLSCKKENDKPKIPQKPSNNSKLSRQLQVAFTTYPSQQAGKR